MSRVILFGMRCAFSETILAGLIAARVEVAAVVLPAPGAALPIVLHWPPEPGRRLPMAGGGIAAMAAAAGIPVAEVPALSHRKVHGWLAARQADAFVVACFPRLLPKSLRVLPTVGAINVHPSLLPIGRGPDPVFWTFRRGERQTGATIHRLTGRFDSGPILAQETVAVPDGIRETELELQLAQLGSRLLVGVLPRLVAGDASEQAQIERLATAAPMPTPADYMMPTNLPARWAFNFARGVAARHGPLRVLTMATGETIDVDDGLSWDAAGRLSQPAIIDGPTVDVQFQPGTARFRLSPQSSTGSRKE